MSSNCKSGGIFILPFLFDFLAPIGYICYMATFGKTTTHVRIDGDTVEKVKKIVEKTKQTVGGWFEIAAKEKIERDKAKLKTS